MHGDYQLEHVVPESGERPVTLDWANLMLACGGGTYGHHRDHTRYAGARGMSCGQTKDDESLPPGCDPRTFDPWHPVVRVDLDGTMRPDPAACDRAGIDPDALQRTIDSVLRLDCERLRTAREERLRIIVGEQIPALELLAESSPNLDPAARHTIAVALAGAELGPDAVGHLRAFWSTRRQYWGVAAEAWLAVNRARVGMPAP